MLKKLLLVIAAIIMLAGIAPQETGFVSRAAAVSFTTIDNTTRIGVSVKKKTGNDNDDQCYLKYSPYESDNTAMVVAKGDLINIVGAVKNKHGNTWYKTEQGYYVYSGDVDVYKYSHVSDLTATFETNEACYVRVAPYAAAPKASSTLYLAGKKISSTRVVKNSYGNIWVELSSGGYLCYYDAEEDNFSLDFVEVGSRASITEDTMPKGTLTKGKDFTMAATIKSKNPIVKIDLRIVDNSTGKVVTNVDRDLGKAMTNIKLQDANGINWNDYIDFADLEAGWYTYYVDVYYGFVSGSRTFRFTEPDTIRSGNFTVGAPKITMVDTNEGIAVSVKKSTGDADDDQCYVKYAPYEAAATIRTFDKGDMINVVAAVKNKHGNVWYKMENGYYVYSGDVEVYSFNTLIEIKITCITTEKITKHKAPYADAPNDLNLAAGTIVTTKRLVSNSYGNIWAQLTDDSWVCLYDIEDKEFKLEIITTDYEATAASVTKPTGTLKQGQTFAVAGKITANYPIMTVIATITDRATGDVVVKKTAKTDNGTLSVDLSKAINGVDFNDGALFTALQPGQYTYMISVQGGLRLNGMTFELKNTARDVIASNFVVEAGEGVVITTQPKNVSVALNKIASVTVKASGEGLTYTWYVKSVGSSKFTKSSITSSTYSVTMTNARNGNQVYCVVTDKYGNSVQSNTVTLSKEVAGPQITQQPQDVSVVLSQTAKVTVKASGEGLTYTWYVKSVGSSKFTKSSLTGTTYSVKMTDARNGNQVYCVVTDKYGNKVQSNTVTLSKVSSGLKITQQPQDVSVALNKTATVTVQASGEGLTYTWYVKSKGSSSFTKSSLTSATYSVKMTDARNGNQIYCVVRDKNGEKVQSNTVTISKTAEALKIISQPQNATAAIGEKAKTTVTATGEGLTYTWYLWKDGEGGFALKKSGITSATYSVTMSNSLNGMQAYCVVTDKHGNSVQSNTVTLSKPAEAVKITAQPQNATAAIGEKAKTTVTATGEGLTYTWYLWKDGEGGFALKKSGITSATYSVTMSNSLNGMHAYCVVTDKYGNSVQSNTVTLSKPAEAVKITAQPQNATAAIGEKAKTTVIATGEGLTYTWYLWKDGEGGFALKKSGITSATYSVTMSNSLSDMQAYCVVTDKYGNSVQSNTVTLTALKPEWTEWSAWSETKPETKEGTREIESRITTKQVETSQYQYTRWHYLNKNTNTYYNHYREYTGSAYTAGSGEWQTKTVDTPLKQVDTIDGYPLYDGYWYHEEQVTTVTSVDVIEYRYRDIK